MSYSKDEIVAKAKKINDVLVDAVFYNHENVLPAFHKLNQNHMTNRQALISFNCLLTEIEYHDSYESDKEIIADIEDMIFSLYEDLCKQ